MGIIDKKQMTEEDIKLNFITPAILSKGWQDKITMETQLRFTDGKVNLRGNIVNREAPKKADYVLYFAKKQSARRGRSKGQQSQRIFWHAAGKALCSNA